MNNFRSYNAVLIPGRLNAEVINLLNDAGRPSGLKDNQLSEKSFILKSGNDRLGSIFMMKNYAESLSSQIYQLSKSKSSRGFDERL